MSVTDAFDWHPSPNQVRDANLTRFIAHTGEADYEALMRRSNDDPEWFWDTLVKYYGLRFTKPYTAVRDASKGPAHTKWFVGGETNLVLNCLDDKTGEALERDAVRWHGEDGTVRRFTYGELRNQVSRLAAAFTQDGFRPGDVIAIYLPMVPEALVAMLAIVKIGCVVLPMFSGFGAAAVATRLKEADAVAIITADGGRRRGQVLPMATVVEQAMAEAPTVRRVVLVRHVGGVATPTGSAWQDWSDYLAGQPVDFPTPSFPSDHPLLLLFTSGTTGKPKGIVLSQGGFLAKAAQDANLYLDLRPEDAFVFMVDVGWVAGPATFAWCTISGCTYVMAEGVPDYPTPDRFWRLIESSKATIVGLTPSLVRGLRRYGDEAVQARDLSAVRLILSSAEPWDRDSWLWTLKNVGHGTAPIINFSGGTEIGGGMVSSIPLYPMKAGCFHGGLLGTGAAILRADGTPAAHGEIGELVLTQSSPGLLTGLWRDEARYLDTYWSMFPDHYVQGDLASRDADCCWFLHGRSDDTIKVAGKRMGPAEIEAALVSTGKVLEAAAVGVPDPVSGSAIVCAVILVPRFEASPQLREELRDAVREAVGSSFRPKDILFVKDLPRTRNMKVMRRLVKSALLGEPQGDTSALLNPETLGDLRSVAAGSR